MSAAALSVANNVVVQLGQDKDRDGKPDGKITNFVGIGSAALGGYLSVSGDIARGTQAYNRAIGASSNAASAANLANTFRNINYANQAVTPWIQLAETSYRKQGKLTPTDWANTASATLSAAIPVAKATRQFPLTQRLQDGALRFGINMLIAGSVLHNDANARAAFIANSVGQELGQFIGWGIVDGAKAIAQSAERARIAREQKRAKEAAQGRAMGEAAAKAGRYANALAAEKRAQKSLAVPGYYRRDGSAIGGVNEDENTDKLKMPTKNQIKSEFKELYPDDQSMNGEERDLRLAQNAPRPYTVKEFAESFGQDLPADRAEREKRFSLNQDGTLRYDFGNGLIVDIQPDAVPEGERPSPQFVMPHVPTREEIERYNLLKTIRGYVGETPPMTPEQQAALDSELETLFFNENLRSLIEQESGQIRTEPHPVIALDKKAVDLWSLNEIYGGSGSKWEEVERMPYESFVDSGSPADQYKYQIASVFLDPKSTQADMERAVFAGVQLNNELMNFQEQAARDFFAEQEAQEYEVLRAGYAERHTERHKDDAPWQQALGLFGLNFKWGDIGDMIALKFRMEPKDIRREARAFMADPTFAADMYDVGGRWAHAKGYWGAKTMERGRWIVGSAALVARGLGESIDVYRWGEGTGELHYPSGTEDWFPDMDPNKRGAGTFTGAGTYRQVWANVARDIVPLTAINMASENAGMFVDAAKMSANKQSLYKWGTELMLTTTSRAGANWYAETFIDSSIRPFPNGVFPTVAQSMVTLGTGYGFTNANVANKLFRMNDPLSWQYKSAVWAAGRSAGVHGGGAVKEYLLGNPDLRSWQEEQH
jgi:hypothetical protein